MLKLILKKIRVLFTLYFKTLGMFGLNKLTEKSLKSSNGEFIFIEKSFMQIVMARRIIPLLGT